VRLWINAAISANVSLLTYLEPRPATYTGQLGQLRDLIVSRVAELRAVQEARALAEERYLDGHAALFPEVAAAWDAQLATTEAMADFTVRLAQAEGVPDVGLADAEVISSRTAQFLADLVQPAKSDALQKLGEGESAYGIANAWLRTKFGAAGPACGPTPWNDRAAHRRSPKSSWDQRRSKRTNTSQSGRVDSCGM
jgi:hypothetical protein